MVSQSRSGEVEMRGSVMLAMLNRVKLKDKEGNEINLYDAYEAHNGTLKLKPGLTYEGKPFTTEDFNKIRNKIIRVNQSIHGIYNIFDSSGVKQIAVGRLIMAMRNWLKPGIDARFRTQYYDERIGEVNEGHYISAINFFNRIYGEKGELKQKVRDLKYIFGVGLNNVDFLTNEEKSQLTEEQQTEVTNMRKANVKKSLFEVYTIAALSVLLMSLWGDGGEEDDSFIRYQMARLRRELISFSSPTTAWDILKSPTGS